MSEVCCDHEHHTWRYTKDAWQVRVLAYPLFTTKNERRVERSRFVWRPGLSIAGAPRLYTLSLIGILHGLFGIVLWIED